MFPPNSSFPCEYFIMSFHLGTNKPGPNSGSKHDKRLIKAPAQTCFVGWGLMFSEQQKSQMWLFQNNTVIYSSRFILHIWWIHLTIIVLMNVINSKTWRTDAGLDYIFTLKLSWGGLDILLHCKQLKTPPLSWFFTLIFTFSSEYYPWPLSSLPCRYFCNGLLKHVAAAGAAERAGRRVSVGKSWPDTERFNLTGVAPFRPFIRGQTSPCINRVGY